MSVPSNLTFAEMQASNLPPAQKSAIRRWYEHVQSGSGAMARAKIHAAAAGNAIRAGGESLLVGGLLGALSVELPTGLDYKKVPIDAAGGALALAAGVAMAHEEFGADLRNAGACALGIFGYRKTQDLLAEKRRQQGKTPGFMAAKAQTTAHGDFGAESGEDPIVTAARML